MELLKKKRKKVDSTHACNMDLVMALTQGITQDQRELQQNQQVFLNSMMAAEQTRNSKAIAEPHDVSRRALQEVLQ